MYIVEFLFLLTQRIYNLVLGADGVTWLSYVVFLLEGNSFCCRRLKDASLSSGMESKLSGAKGFRDHISPSHPTRLSKKWIIKKQEDTSMSN